MASISDHGEDASLSASPMEDVSMQATTTPFFVDLPYTHMVEELDDHILPQDLGDHDLVDVSIFKALLTQQNVVKRNFFKLNANLTILTEASKCLP